MEDLLINKENQENKGTKKDVDIDELTEKLLGLKVESEKKSNQRVKSINNNHDDDNKENVEISKTYNKGSKTVSKSKSDKLCSRSSTERQRARKPLSNFTNTIN